MIALKRSLMPHNWAGSSPAVVISGKCVTEVPKEEAEIGDLRGYECLT